MTDTYLGIECAGRRVSGAPAGGALSRLRARLAAARQALRLHEQQSRFARYSGAVVVNLLALSLAFLLEPQFSSSPFVLFLAAVIYSSWYGGRLAGLAAVAFGTWTSNYFLLTPIGPSGIYRPEDILRVGMFALVALLVSAVNSARSAQRQAELRSREAQAKQEWLNHLSEQRATMVSTVSHALRAPLAAMMVNIEMLEDGILGQLNAEQLEYLQRATRSMEQLSETVDDLLAISRLKDGRVSLSAAPVDPAQLLSDVRAKMLPRARSSGVGLELELDPDLGTITTDRRKLDEIATELAENGLKYTPRGGQVRLLARNAPGGIRMEIADDGPGIPETEREQVFEPFYRSQAALREQIPGSGLGLSIVKETAALLQINVQVERGAKGGAVFALQIPRSISLERALPEAAALLSGTPGSPMSAHSPRAATNPEMPRPLHRTL
jgi:signal transduction histidine kinase